MTLSADSTVADPTVEAQVIDRRPILSSNLPGRRLVPSPAEWAVLSRENCGNQHTPVPILRLPASGRRFRRARRKTATMTFGRAGSSSFMRSSSDDCVYRPGQNDLARRGAAAPIG